MPLILKKYSMEVGVGEDGDNSFSFIFDNDGDEFRVEVPESSVVELIRHVSREVVEEPPPPAHRQPTPNRPQVLQQTQHASEPEIDIDSLVLEARNELRKPKIKAFVPPSSDDDINSI